MPKADLQKYTTQKPDYLAPFEDSEFGALHEKAIASGIVGTYLDGVAEYMLTEIMPDYTPEEFANFTSWVYVFRQTIRKKVLSMEKATSDAFKAQIVEGSKVKLAFKATNMLGGEGNTPLTLYKVIKNSAGRLFLLTPRCRTRGYPLDNLTITALQEISK